jgi:hypothetical protein
MNQDQELLEPVGGAGQEGEVQVAEGGEAELRKDSMMAHLLDSLKAGKDIGHYGRLVLPWSPGISCRTRRSLRG